MGNKKNRNRKSKIKANNWRGIIRMRKPKALLNLGHHFEEQADARIDFQSQIQNQPNIAADEIVDYDQSGANLLENQPNNSADGRNVFDQYIEIVDDDQRSANLPENQPNNSADGRNVFDQYIEIVDDDQTSADLPEGQLATDDPNVFDQFIEIFDDDHYVANLPENQPNETDVLNCVAIVDTFDHDFTKITGSVSEDSLNQPSVAFNIFDDYAEILDDDASLPEYQPSAVYFDRDDVMCPYNEVVDLDIDPNDQDDVNIGRDESNIEMEQNSTDGELVGETEQHTYESDSQTTNHANNAQYQSQSITSMDQTQKELSGRRVVDIKSLFEQIRELKHSETCHVEDMKCTDEIRKGLLSIFEFTCTECGHQQKIKSFDHGIAVDLNSAAVLGITAVGLGGYHLNEFCTNLEIPCMTDYLYDKKQKIQQLEWWSLAKKSALDALKEEIRLAILNGDIDSNGNAFIVIVCDGSWPKRSYTTNFSSLSGCAVMIGVRTNKVLYFDVKDKYCHVCKIAEGKKAEPRIHECNKNFVGPSSSMETAIIIEGFQYCDKLGARFKEYIADGDSSTHKNLTELKIYQEPEQPVEKDECCNHLCRNYRSAFGKLGKGTKKSKANKLLTKKKGNDICKGIQTAAKHWRNSNIDLVEKLTNLEKDIFNAPLHYYGVHDGCGSYFCNKTTTPEGLENVTLLKKEGKWDQILNLLQKYFASNVASLLLNYNNNAAESFNNLVAKLIGGKRINYCLAHSYRSRVARAVVQYNTGGHAGSTYHEAKNSYSTSGALKAMEDRRKRKCIKNAIAQESKPKKARFSEQTRDKGVHYGENCQKIDMSAHMFDIAKQRYLQPMLDDQSDKKSIFTKTLGQRNCREWRDMQSKLLTSFYFTRIIKSRGPASYTSILDDIVYKKLIFSKSADNRHQSIYDKKALQSFTLVHGSNYLSQSGLFIDDDHCFLGATPFRLYGDNGIVFIKCPLAAFKKTIQEAIDKKLINFWKTESGVEVVNKTSEWYIEVQGELHITCKTFAFVVVWVESEFRIEKVYRDDDFWYDMMEEKLVYFYENVMLKEQVDPRKRRQMNLRKYNTTTKLFE